MRNRIDYFNELASEQNIAYYRFGFKYFEVIKDTSGWS